MKKTALVLALGSAFAGAALAQSSVTLYGIADVGVLRAPVADANTGSPNATGTFTPATGVTAGKVNQTVMQSGQQSGSRLGFRGTEDLGNGLSAVFTLEQRVEFDTGGSSSSGQNGAATVGVGGRQFERQIFAGLSSKTAGTLTFGRQYTPQFDIQVRTDALAYGMAGSFTSGAGFGMMASRASNAIKYVSPNWGGFQGRLLYSFGGSGLAAAGSGTNEIAPNTTSNTATNTGNTVDKAADKALGLGFSWENKQILAGYTYTKSYAGAGTGNPALISSTFTATSVNPVYVNNVAVGSVNGYGPAAGTVSALNPAYSSGDGFEKWHTFNFSYDFNVAKVFLNYVNVKNSISSNFITGTITGNATVTGAGNNGINNSWTARGDRNIINAAVAVPFGANKVTVSYSKFNDKGFLDQDASLIGLAYEYSLSKRTNLYAQAARMANKNSAVWGFGGAGYGATNLSTVGGQSGVAFGVGMRHAF